MCPHTPFAASTPEPSVCVAVSPTSSEDDEAREHYREFRPCCDHNNWDNVRVSKKVMTLRCRVCQKQWRAHVEEVWSKWKCGVYSSGACHAGCEKLHINYRKQGLETRFLTHGSSVLDHVRVGRTQYDLQDKVKTLKGKDARTPGTQLLVHDPYSWEGQAVLQY